LLSLVFYSEPDAQKLVNIHEIPHVSVAEQPQKWSRFSRADSITPLDVTTASNDPLDEYNSFDSFDSDDDEAFEETENNTVGVKSSRSISDPIIELKNSASNYCTKPLSTSNSDSSQDFVLTPQSRPLTVLMPLPKLPFESDGSIIPQGMPNYEDRPRLSQSTVINDSISRVSEPEQKSPTTLPRPNQKLFALSSTPNEKRNHRGDTYVNVIAQTHETEIYDDAYEVIDFTSEDYVNSPLSPSVDFEKKKTGKDATIEELKVSSTPKRNSLANIAETVATTQKDYDSTAIPNTSSPKGITQSLSKAVQYKCSQHYYEDIDFDFSGDDSKVLPPCATAVQTCTESTEKSSTSVSIATKPKPKASLPLCTHGKTISHTHTMPADKVIPDDAAYKPNGKQIPASELIYDDTIPQKVERSSVSELIYDDTILQKVDEGSVNLSSEVNHRVVTPQSTSDANSSITIQPIYCNTPINRKSVRSQATSVYVKMYKVKPLAWDDDQTSDSQAEVYSYDYTYHRNLRLRKYGKECDGVPPRNIRRYGYTESADYVNADTQCDYVNFKALENTPIASPPRGSSTSKSGAISEKETAMKPIPKRRTNVRPALPPRNIPRERYYLSGPIAVPPNYM